MSKDIYRTLKFKIGEDLKHRMHEVIPIPPVGNLEEGTHPYEYFGDINKILNIPTSRIILFFQGPGTCKGFDGIRYQFQNTAYRNAGKHRYGVT